MILIDSACWEQVTLDSSNFLNPSLNFSWDFEVLKEPTLNGFSLEAD